MIARLLHVGLRRHDADRGAWPARQARLRGLLAGARLAGWPRVALHTCERFEVWLALPAGEQQGDPGTVAEIARRAGAEGLLAARGPSAAGRLLRIASGLDSRFAGESEVLGQLRAAFRSAPAGMHDALLRRVFQAALRAGRIARAADGWGPLPASYAGLAAAALAEGGQRAAIGLLGSGALARQIVAHLEPVLAERVTVFSGHVERAAAAIGRPVAAVRPLVALDESLPRFDALIAATRAQRAIITPQRLALRRAALRIFDLGMPPLVDPAVAGLPGVTLRTLDDLAPERPAQESVARVTRLVERELARLLAGLADFERYARAGVAS